MQEAVQPLSPFELFDTFENLSKEGEYTSGGDSLYFKNWTPQESFDQFTLDTEFRAATGHRMFDHAIHSVRYIYNCLRAGTMQHPQGEQIIKLLDTI